MSGFTALDSPTSSVVKNASTTRQTLRSGSVFNAEVSVVSTAAGLRVVKDFSRAPLIVRNTLGRLLIRREYATLQKLQGLLGVPPDAMRLHAFALSYQFVPGETLATVLKQRIPLEHDFFPALEHMVAGLHARGFLHLDLRNGGNILRTSEGKPSLLDFQSGLWVFLMPSFVRRLLRAVDFSGVYKWWALLAPGRLSPKRVRLLHSVNRWRLLWRFNYPADDSRLRH